MTSTTLDEDHEEDHDDEQPGGAPGRGAAFASPEQVLENAQLRQCIVEAMARFAADRKGNRERALALRLVILDGCSLDEVAGLLGRTPGGAMRVFMLGCRRAVRAYLHPCWRLLAPASENEDA